MNEFKEALERLDPCKYAVGDDYYIDVGDKKHIDVIRKALRIADRLMQEPSEGMMRVCQVSRMDYSEFEEFMEWEGEEMIDVFENMLDQMLKEIEDEPIKMD